MDHHSSFNDTASTCLYPIDKVTVVTAAPTTQFSISWPAELQNATARRMPYGAPRHTFTITMFRLLLVLWTLTTVLAMDEPIGHKRPVVLIPGFASTQLVAWRKHSCSYSIQKNLYRDVKVGDRLWIDIARIIAQGDCWLRCMKLHMDNQTEMECKLRAGEGLLSISELDPGFVTGPLSTIWRGLVVDLVDHFHFEPDEIIVATYDWRLPPSRLQERDKYFLSLKRKFENVNALHGDSTGGGAVVIAHSMGNNMFRYFLEWLKHEVGRNHWQEWIDKHISSYFAVGAPLLGSPEAMELLTSGITQGLPVPQSEIRKMVATFGSILTFIPIPSVPPTSHDSDVLISVKMSSASKQHASPENTIERNYTSADIASGALFRDMAVHDPIFGHLETIRKRFYANDDILDAFSPWERPPIASVYVVYGTNLETKYNYRYQDTDVEGHWYQLALENEMGHRQVCGKTGDGTVPYHSLSWAHTWLGPSGTLVNITRAPQSVYFSSDQTKSFKAMRKGAKHHADYVKVGTKKSLCDNAKSTSETSSGSSFFGGIFGGKSKVDEVTFYESRQEVNGRTWTTSVWEVESARHREILSNSAFLRELRTELRHVFKGLSGADKSARPPTIDSDCYWNYRQARCEFPEFCQYRYVFGDVVLDQSCRLRIHPLPEKNKKKMIDGAPAPLLLSDGLRNSGYVTSPQCMETATCGANGTPITVTLPVVAWNHEDYMTSLVPLHMPGCCPVPCEYCRYPISKQRAHSY